MGNQNQVFLNEVPTLDNILLPGYQVTLLTVEAVLAPTLSTQVLEVLTVGLLRGPSIITNVIDVLDIRMMLIIVYRLYVTS